MKYFLSAGEASGDIHAANLIRHLRGVDPDAQFEFLGGDKMAAEAGHAPVIHYRRMAFMGFSEVIRHLPAVLGNFKRARAAIGAQAPDALILIDYPSFNLRLAEWAMRRDIAVYYYIPPKVWAWKQWRVKKLKQLTRRLYCILPFEPAFYSRRGVDSALYVGNPSREEVDEKLAALQSRDRFIADHDLTSRPILALVPGSRESEIRNNLPIMTAVAQRHPDMQAVIAGAPSIDMRLYRSITTLPIVSDATFELMAHAEAALVTSGTATLECALIGTPQVALYRANGSRISHALFSRILKVDFVTLPNLIAGREIIPEMLLHHCNHHEVDAALTPLLAPDSPERAAQLEAYREMRHTLGTGRAAATAAIDIFNDIRQS